MYDSLASLRGQVEKSMQQNVEARIMAGEVIQDDDDLDIDVTVRRAVLT